MTFLLRNISFVCHPTYLGVGTVDGLSTITQPHFIHFCPQVPQNQAGHGRGERRESAPVRKAAAQNQPDVDIGRGDALYLLAAAQPLQHHYVYVRLEREPVVPVHGEHPDYLCRLPLGLHVLGLHEPHPLRVSFNLAASQPQNLLSFFRYLNESFRAEFAKIFQHIKATACKNGNNNNSNNNGNAGTVAIGMTDANHVTIQATPNHENAAEAAGSPSSPEAVVSAEVNQKLIDVRCNKVDKATNV